MDLIDRYVYDVGRRLPAKGREDIEKELKSLLMDALEARGGSSAGGYADEDVAAVLKAFGHPSKVAARYAGEKYLIGPELYPTYRMVLLIVLGALALGLFVSRMLAFVLNGPDGQDVARQLLQLLGSLVTSVWSAIGAVTVVFWGIGRGMGRSASKLDFNEPWDPKTLPQVPKPVNQRKPADSIAAIVFTILAMVIFNGYPDAIAVYFSNPGEALQHYPLLSQAALAAYMPLWNTGWALSIALQAMLLIQGRWRTGTRLAHAAIQLFSAAVAVVMLTGPALLNVDALTGAGGAMEALHRAMPIVIAQFRWVFVVIIVACAADAVLSVYRALRER